MERIFLKRILSGANLSEADLIGANLSRSNLSGANLSGADLSRSNLYVADLSGANLSRSNLSGADLSRSNLFGANLSGANLSGANLIGADLRGAVIDDAAFTDLVIKQGPVRSDGHQYILFISVPEGCVIKAGCRTWSGEDAFEQARLHSRTNTDPKHAAEALRIIDFLESEFEWYNC